jgi:hypothetical protein
LAEDRIEDALMLLGASHEPASAETIVTAAVWRTKDDATLRTLTEVIDGFQESRAYLFPTTEQPAPAPAGPVYSDGRPVPPSEMTTDELAAAAGPAPEAQAARLPTYTPEQLDAMTDLERSIARASAAPPPEPLDDAEAVQAVADELRQRDEVRDELHKEQIERLKEGGLKIDPPVRKWGQS